MKHPNLLKGERTRVLIPHTCNTPWNASHLDGNPTQRNEVNAFFKLIEKKRNQKAGSSITRPQLM
jgi:hypothetical protein